MNPKLKVIFLGNTAVGKTSIFRLFNKYQLDNDLKNSISATCVKQTITLDDKTVQVCSWDTAGQERFRSVTISYLRGADLALLIVDLTDAESLEGMRYWRQMLVDRAIKTKIIVVGNKCEHSSKIDTSELITQTRQWDVQYVECSAVSGQGIEELFTAIRRKLAECLVPEPVKLVLEAPIIMPQHNEVVKKLEGDDEQANRQKEIQPIVTRQRFQELQVRQKPRNRGCC